MEIKKSPKDSIYKFFVWCLFTSIFLALINEANAADLLAGTETAAKDTLYGTGKVYFYVGEVIFGIVLFITTRKYTALIGVVIISIFMNSVLPHFI